MGQLDLFRKKKNQPEKQESEKADPPSDVSAAPVLPDKKDADPHEHNSALFERFYHDLENGTLPQIPDPTEAEIAEYTRKKDKRLSKDDPLFSAANMTKLLENHSIPVEADIWADKVFEHYFDDLIPVLGLVYQSEAARRDLYRYKGYTWHTIIELYPAVIFD